MTRFYHAFKWQTVVDYIKDQTKGIVLIATPGVGGGDKNILNKLRPEDKARLLSSGDIYDDAEVQHIIRAASKPSDTGWSDWFDTHYGSLPFWIEELEKCDAALHVTTLILMDHPNRTKNLHKILAETKLSVISSTEKHVNRPAGKNRDGEETVERVPNVSWLYGRPLLPDFDNLTDEMFDMYSRDGVSDLDSLIPVYDFSVQSFSYKQMLDAPLKKREPLVLLNQQPMMWSESITELFAWRSTGKTLFSLGLGLHLAAGKSMPGLEIPSPRKVLYVEGELPASQLQERIHQLGAGLEIPAGSFEVIAKSCQPHDKGQSPVTIRTEAGRLAIESELERTGAEVLFIDSIASLAQINTNNEEQWLPIIEWMVDLRCKGICVVYLQQAGKSGEQRGHSVSEDRIDLAIRLTATNTNPDGAAFAMSFTKEREGSLTPLRLKCTKGVWALDGAKAAKKPTTPNNEDRDKLILEALNSGESQRAIATRFKVSLRTVTQVKQGATTNDNTCTDVSS